MYSNRKKYEFVVWIVLANATISPYLDIPLINSNLYYFVSERLLFDDVFVL